MSDASTPPPTDRRPGNSWPNRGDRRFESVTTETEVLTALRTVTDPQFGDDIVSLGLVEDVSLSADTVTVWLGLYAPHAPEERRIVRDVHRLLGDDDREVVTLAATRRRARPGRCRVPGVRNVVPFVGTDDGVGTTTVAANAAVALADRGARVGVLDADMTAPDVHTAFSAGSGGDPNPTSPLTESDLVPSTRHGVRVLEVTTGADPGVVTDDASQAAVYERLCCAAEWGRLDYLFVDLGAEPVLQEAFLETVAVDGAVLTAPSTPPRRAVTTCRSRLRDVGVPLLGTVETAPNGDANAEPRPLRGAGLPIDLGLIGSVPFSETAAAATVPTLETDDDLRSAYDDIAAEIANAVGRLRRSRDAAVAD